MVLVNIYDFHNIADDLPFCSKYKLLSLRRKSWKVIEIVEINCFTI